MHATRCKFVCTAIEPQPYSDSSKVTLEARYCPEVPDDVRFTTATPWGSMSVGISNPEALKLFEVGKAYYVDIVPAQA